MVAPISAVNCFVGMFDIIGFKALRDRLGTGGLHQKYVRGIAPAIAHAAAGSGNVADVDGRKMYVPNFTPLSPAFRAISDTALFFTRDDTFLSFVSIVHSSFSLLQFGFNGGKAPYRGAIGWGDLINDPSGILIGSAVEDAYAGESSQVWAGCMLTDSCRTHCVSQGYIQQFSEFHRLGAAQIKDEAHKRVVMQNAERLVEYPIPLQSNPRDRPAVYFTRPSYAVDWTIRMYEGAGEESFEASENPHAQRIAANTIAFEKWARARKG